jgi:hypothetical protein
MRPGLLGCLLLVLATDAFAHRLDEYLQATRVSVAANRIDLSIDLTPGVTVADQVLEVIDQDRDGRVSGDECTIYAQRVLKDIRVGLDGKVLALSLVDASFPALHEVKGGIGVIRIKATAPVDQLSVGRHTLSLTNAHLPAISVYLVNALVPKDPAIRIKKQMRDEFQKAYRLEFGVNALHIPMRTPFNKILVKPDRKESIRACNFHDESSPPHFRALDIRMPGCRLLHVAAARAGEGKLHVRGAGADSAV